MLGICRIVGKGFLVVVCVLDLSCFLVLVEDFLFPFFSPFLLWFVQDTLRDRRGRPTFFFLLHFWTVLDVYTCILFSLY